MACLCGKRAEFLEAYMDGSGELADGDVVAVGSGKENYEESEEEGYEIGIGDQPAVVSGRLFGVPSSSGSPRRSH
jgi:hypothetical protein